VEDLEHQYLLIEIAINDPMMLDIENPPIRTNVIARFRALDSLAEG